MSSQILEKDITITDWVEHTKSLLSIPYRWGGSDTLGLIVLLCYNYQRLLMLKNYQEIQLINLIISREQKNIKFCKFK